MNFFETPVMEKRLSHMLAVFYQRKAFDLHNSGKSREEAEALSKAAVLADDEIPKDVIFPPVAWGRYEEFYSHG